MYTLQYSVPVHQSYTGTVYFTVQHCTVSSLMDIKVQTSEALYSSPFQEKPLFTNLKCSTLIIVHWTYIKLF